MKRNENVSFYYFCGILLVFSAAALLFCPSITAQATEQSLAICLRSLLPSLFPFFVLTELWTALGYAEQLSHAASCWMERIFHLPGSAASALIAGYIGGYPVGAQTIAKLYENQLLDRDSAEYALRFCNNAGPAFIFGVVGVGLFHSVSAGAFLYGLHLVSAWIIGFLFRPPSSPKGFSTRSYNTQPLPFSAALPDAIVHAGKTLLRVFAFVFFFGILSAFLRSILPSRFAGTLLSSLLIGSLELAGGISLLSVSPCSYPLLFASAAFLLGWGGLCVHLQTLSILRTTGISTKRYFSGKFLQGLLSAVLAGLLCPLVPPPLSCIATEAQPWHFPLWQLGLFFLFLSIISYFLKLTSGKKQKNHI